MKEWMNSREITMMVTRKDQSFPVTMAISALSREELVIQSNRFLHLKEHTTLTGEAQHHYLLGRHAAKLAASHYTQTAPTAICITPGVFGQPILDCPGHNNLQVSISHSGHRAMAVVFPEKHPMAVDIESISSGHLVPPLSAREAAFTDQPLLLWTAKEALSKVLKTGLTTELEIFAIAAVNVNGNFLVSTFVHFMQYKAISWIAGNMVCSLVLPERSGADLAALETLTSL